MFVNRINQMAIFNSFGEGFVTALLGPRRVGKSSLVQAFVEKHPDYSWVVLNCDDFELRRRLSSGNVLRQIIEETTLKKMGSGKKVWIVIDEVQKSPDCFEQIKILYDEFKDKNTIKFIITGSALLELHRLSAETLAGRIELFYIYEFSLQEEFSYKYQTPLAAESILRIIFENRLELLEEEIKKKQHFSKKLDEILGEQLLWGGFPEVIPLDDKDRKLRYLSNYLQTYLEKDIRPISSISNLELYRQMMDVLAEQTGSMREDAKILNALGCSRDTLKKYRDILSSTLLFEELYPFISSAIKRVSKSPKGYLLNNGLISYLTGVDSIDILEVTNTLGHRFENWFFKELKVVLANRPHRTNIKYWRMSSGREVDFIVDYKPHIFPIEVTYSSKLQSKKVKNLMVFMENEANALFGIYVYNGGFAIDYEKRICYLPAWSIC